jgi:hypothetical protein
VLELTEQVVAALLITVRQGAVDAATNEMLYLCPSVLWERLGVQAP